MCDLFPKIIFSLSLLYCVITFIVIFSYIKKHSYVMYIRKWKELTNIPSIFSFDFKWAVKTIMHSFIWSSKNYFQKMHT